MTRSNRSRLAASAVSTVAGLSVLAMFVAPTEAVGHAVAIRDSAFSPRTITIPVGDTVTWTNLSGLPHNVMFSSFGSPMYMDRGDQWPHTFSRPGTFSYTCTLHGFSGKVIVTGKAAPKPTTKQTSKPTPEPTSSPTLTPMTAPTPSPTATATPAATPTTAPAPTPTGSPSVVSENAATSDAGGPPIAIVVALAALALVGGGALVLRRR